MTRWARGKGLGLLLGLLMGDICKHWMLLVYDQGVDLVVLIQQYQILLQLLWMTNALFHIMINLATILSIKVHHW